AVSPGNEGSLANLADQRLIFTDLPAGSLEEVLTEMSRRLAAAGAVPDGEELKRRLLERERLGCTGLGGGVAIPHCKIRGISDIVFSIGSAPAGVDFHAADGIPVTLIFLILSPADAPAAHLQALARISRLLKAPGAADSLRAARDPEQVLTALKEAEAGQAVVNR
ncbi:MAG TPA: PTS sugar transporter subunit IIA, partial [Thermoanaerobaculia bacterium]|nr:PTS sugar transporter subunit IIA [Thermoanaerobaculia bacterium]